MPNNDPLLLLEQEIKDLIVSALRLEDVDPTNIDSKAPLFNDGLGLDSIDALELAVALERHFGIKMKSDDDTNRRIFASVQTLAQYIVETRGKQS